MKSTVDQLTTKEREALVHFYGNDAYNALKRLCKLEIEGLGKDALISPNHEMTKWYGGQAQMAAKLLKIVKSLYDEDKKRRDKEQKS